MKINIAGQGVHRREITGVEKLRDLPPEWYAFPNLEMIRSGAMPRQIDIVIVLDDRILLVDRARAGRRCHSDAWIRHRGAHQVQRRATVGAEAPRGAR